MRKAKSRDNSARLDPIALTMHSLRLDRMAGEVSEHLAENGIECILLKGSSTAKWLYADGDVRPYVDVDLLIDIDDIDDVSAGLRELGFTSSTDRSGLPEIEHAHNWARADGDLLDLHFDLPSSLARDPHAVWAVLRDRAVVDSVGGSDVLVLDAEARAVVVVLHAISSGRDVDQPLHDLRRLLELFEMSEWDRVASLVRLLDVEDAFSAGLRLTKDGEALARYLGFPEPTTTLFQLKLDGQLNSAIAIDRITGAGSVREAVVLVLKELFPNPQGLRRLHPLANRGRSGLLAAYVARPFAVIAGLPGGLLSWLRARRRVTRRNQNH